MLQKRGMGKTSVCVSCSWEAPSLHACELLRPSAAWLSPIAADLCSGRQDLGYQVCFSIGLGRRRCHFLIWRLYG